MIVLVTKFVRMKHQSDIRSHSDIQNLKERGRWTSGDVYRPIAFIPKPAEMTHQQQSDAWANYIMKWMVEEQQKKINLYK